MPGHGVKMTLTGDWKKAQQVLAQAPSDVQQAMQAAAAAVAEFMAGRVKRKIGEGIPPPNSPFTVALKGSSKTLANKGDLKNSVRAVKTGKFSYFVGIPSSVRGATGQEVARLADVLERGRVIVQRMTAKQRAFLHAKFREKFGKLPSKPGTGILIIHIPPRPFIQPVFEESQQDIEPTFVEYFFKNLKRLGK